MEALYKKQAYSLFGVFTLALRLVVGWTYFLLFGED